MVNDAPRATVESDQGERDEGAGHNRAQRREAPPFQVKPRRPERRGWFDVRLARFVAQNAHKSSCDVGDAHDFSS